MLLGGVALSFLSWRVIRDNEEAATRERFERRVDETVTEIRRRMFDHEQLLRGGGGLFAASDAVSRTEWSAFSASLSLDEDYPGVLGFGNAELLGPSDVERHLVRSDGFPHYTVEPAGARPQYAPITYIEPFYGRNVRSFGFDMYPERTRRIAMDRARDTGDAALTGRVALAQDAGGPARAGALMYVPVYRRGLPIHTVAARRAALVGWVFCPFRMSDLMPVIGNHVGDMTFELFDGALARPEARMFAARTDVAAAIPG